MTIPADEALQMKHPLFALLVLIGLTAPLLWRPPGRPLQSLPFRLRIVKR
jgi:hypothetical protein